MWQREYQVGTTSLRPWQVLHGDNKRTLLMTSQKAVGRSIINYAAPVLESKPTRHQLHKNPLHTERGSEDRYWMSQDVQHRSPTEAEMLKVKEHSELLSAQYLARYLEPGNVCHPITTRATPERQMKETLYTRHRNTVESMMVKNDRKATLQALHTAAVWHTDCCFCSTL